MIYRFQEYKPTEIIRNHLKMGGANPAGERIDVTNLYFERAGKPWIAVMGEYHFVRASREDWRRELCKMKAGGITTVATYLFWIYHEELEGEFNFFGDRDLRGFVEICGDVGLDVVIRVGPWAHGECRNGGFPDWLLRKPYTLRDNNAEYMAKVRIWYEKIYEQVKGLFYKDGGNIIAMQLENELVDRAEHLKALKDLAVDIGYEVPIYTVTGWNSAAGAQIPVDEVVPVFGGYVELPWSASLTKLPPSTHYFFNRMRNDSAIGTDLIARTKSDGWQLPYERYPFATCELGGGVQITHHRRGIIRGMDIYALSLVKLGSGNNLVGYYMYHGGTNKIGKLTTLNESKATGYPNDYPILSYDFQAPISEYGEIREQYRLLNILHLFVNDFDERLAPMEAVDAENFVQREDLSSLRYSMRTDGESGFVFVNHYQRLDKLENVLDVEIDTGIVKFPRINVCGENCFFMPFNMKLGELVLEYATAQPLCRVCDAYFFVEIEGVTPEYRFADGKVCVSNPWVWNEKIGNHSCLLNVKPEKFASTQVGDIRIVTLSMEQARYARKINGKLYIGKACDLYEMDGQLHAVGSEAFAYYEWTGAEFEEKLVGGALGTDAEAVLEACREPFVPPYAEELNLGGERMRTWQKISVNQEEGMIELNYAGDVAQIYADGELVADEYYKGTPWRIPAKLLYGRECYLVISELRDDFYKEYE